jgi:hypothetical protein
MQQGNRAPNRPMPDPPSPIRLDSGSSSTSLSALDKRRDYREIGVCVALFAIALAIGCIGVTRSGPVWVDAPQYANGGAMIRDWLTSNQWLRPFDFARENYTQYPAFSIPYHPPGYPGMLGVFFLLSGVSYESARVFVALLLGVAGCAFYAILRRFTVDRAPAFACALLLLTMPEVVRWSRDTMSEIPALACILVAAYGFLRWLETARYRDAIFAFLFAGLAFFSKINVIGVLLAWPVWIAIRGRWRKALSPSLLIPAVVFLAIVAAWTDFFIPWARYETQIGLTSAELAAGRSVGVTPLPDGSLALYFGALPAMTGWTILAASLVGLAATVRLPDVRRASAMWVAWFVGYLAFLLIIPLHYEARYFTFALPALPALVGLLFVARRSQRIPQWFGYALVAVVLVENLVRLRGQPSGVVGYDRVASRLSALDKSGNVLVSVPFQNDLMFRYRAASPESKRQFIRGDRSIALSLPTYAPVANRLQVLVNNPETFLDLIQRGRVRYAVTVAPRLEDTRVTYADDALIVVARNVASLPNDFAPVDSFRLHFGELWFQPEMLIYVWEYRHALPTGPSELPIVIPTAGVTFRPGDTATAESKRSRNPK